ncbi:MAG: MFS transporter, partial [Armatimonadota bacterium]|nr:MFS transporter [Armatimonadota bacterium]
LVFWACMWLSAATELGTNQWIPEMMKNAGIKVGTLVLGWISFVMLIGRVFAGPVVHKLSPIGVLLLSSIVSCVGLLALSVAKDPIVAFIAATVFSVGICYFWPTMLGYTSERFPEGGALLMGLMGAAGMASAGFAQPIFGGWYEKYGVAGALRHAAVIPAILTVVMAVFYVIHKLEGGYRAIKLTTDESVTSIKAIEGTSETAAKAEKG